MSQEPHAVDFKEPEIISPTRTDHTEHAPSVSHASSVEHVSRTLSKTRSRLGLHPQHPVKYEDDELHQMNLLWPKIRLILREPFAEFFGTMIMVLFGDGSVAQVLLSKDEAAAPGGTCENGLGQKTRLRSRNRAWVRRVSVDLVGLGKFLIEKHECN